MTVYRLEASCVVDTKKCPGVLRVFEENSDQALYDAVTKVAGWKEAGYDDEVAVDDFDRVRVAVSPKGKEVHFIVVRDKDSLMLLVLDCGGETLIGVLQKKLRADTERLVSLMEKRLEALIPEGKEVVLNRWATDQASVFDMNMPVAYLDNACSAPYPDCWLAYIYSLRHKDGRLEYSVVGFEKRLVYYDIHSGSNNDLTMMNIYDRIDALFFGEAMDNSRFEVVDFVGEFAAGEWYSIVPAPDFGGVTGAFGVVTSPMDYLFQEYGLEYNNAFHTKADAETFFKEHGMKESQFRIRPFDSSDSEEDKPLFYTSDGKPENGTEKEEEMPS